MRVFYMNELKTDIYTTKGIEIRVCPDQDCPMYRMADVMTSKGTYKLYEIGRSGHFVYRCRIKNIGLMFSFEGNRSSNELLFGSAEEADSFESLINIAHGRH